MASTAVSSCRTIDALAEEDDDADSGEHGQGSAEEDDRTAHRFRVRLDRHYIVRWIDDYLGIGCRHYTDLCWSPCRRFIQPIPCAQSGHVTKKQQQKQHQKSCGRLAPSLRQERKHLAVKCDAAAGKLFSRHMIMRPPWVDVGAPHLYIIGAKYDGCRFQRRH